jgi:DUF971 family protein
MSTTTAADVHPTAIRREGEHHIVIDWSDGHRGLHSFGGLRKGCPCAGCREERDQQKGKITLPLLNMGRSEPLRPVEINPVGRYAYGIVWNDGHATGIYRFDLLRSLCECTDCRPAPAK